MGYGSALGAVNGFAVSILLGIVERDWRLGVFLMIFGVITGLIVGAISGLIAQVSGKAPFVVRYPLIVLFPALTVMLLGAVLFRPSWVVALLSVPTVVLCFVLEKWTRAPRAEPVIPSARIA